MTGEGLHRRARRWRRSTVALAVLPVAVATALPLILAGRGEGAPALSESTASSADRLHRGSEAALLDLYAAESALARAASETERLRAEARTLRMRISRTTTERRSAQAVRRTAQAQAVTYLRALYLRRPTDPIAILLGADTFESAIDGIDGLERMARKTTELADEARERYLDLGRVQQRLADQQSALRATLAGSEIALSSLAEARDDKAALVHDLRRRAQLTGNQVSRLETQAQKAQERSAALTEKVSVSNDSPAEIDAQGDQVETTPTSTSASTPAASGTHMLDVSAVAYSLPGSTAIGLPVGRGIIAVDPRVIPLGSRVYVPGYGDAIAADTGSAVVGNMIDVWLPTLAEAQAWGRRAVTITIYG